MSSSTTGDLSENKEKAPIYSSTVKSLLLAESGGDFLTLEVLRSTDANLQESTEAMRSDSLMGKQHGVTVS